MSKQWLKHFVYRFIKFDRIIKKIVLLSLHNKDRFYLYRRKTMMLLSMLITIVLSLFATATLSYISMAVSLGPWIEPTIILLATLLLVFKKYRTSTLKSEDLTLITAGASIGGIMAIGCGFAFPTFNFIQPDLFNQMVANPWYFSAIMTSICLVSGSFGLLIASWFEHRLLITEQLAFPIGQMSYKMITAQNQIKKALELAAGFVCTLIYSMFVSVFQMIPRSIALNNPLCIGWCSIPPLKLMMLELPMLWSIGFVTGHVIAIPLLIGIISKIAVCNPLHAQFFPHLRTDAFLLAFCSGMVMYGALLSFLDLPGVLYKAIQKLYINRKNNVSINSIPFQWPIVLVAGGLIALLWYFKFSVISQIYLIIFTIVCVYQLLLIGGKLGIAPMPRFATFVMVPGILLFGFDAIQATVVSTLVEVAGGVAVDVLFGRKMGLLADVSPKKIRQFQWLGLIVSSFSIGIIFWLLIKHFGLGSAQLCAQRAQTRALLIGIRSFDFFALIAGALYGALLKECKINASLVLGGILMSLEYSVILTLGGLSTYLVADKEQWYPWWSGMFAASSIWMIIQAIGII